MNNDSTPSPAAPLPTTSPVTVVATTPTTTPRNAPSPAQKRFQAQINKKLDFIDELAKHTDMLIYMELCILYYME
jgi:hypothetical protein